MGSLCVYVKCTMSRKSEARAESLPVRPRERWETNGIKTTTNPIFNLSFLSIHRASRSQERGGEIQDTSLFPVESPTRLGFQGMRVLRSVEPLLLHFVAMVVDDGDIQHPTLTPIHTISHCPSYYCHAHRHWSNCELWKLRSWEIPGGLAPHNPRY